MAEVRKASDWLAEALVPHSQLGHSSEARFLGTPPTSHPPLPVPVLSRCQAWLPLPVRLLSVHNFLSVPGAWPGWTCPQPDFPTGISSRPHTATSQPAPVPGLKIRSWLESAFNLRTPILGCLPPCLWVSFLMFSLEDNNSKHDTAPLLCQALFQVLFIYSLI